MCVRWSSVHRQIKVQRQHRKREKKKREVLRGICATVVCSSRQRWQWRQLLRLRRRLSICGASYRAATSATPRAVTPGASSQWCSATTAPSTADIPSSTREAAHCRTRLRPRPRDGSSSGCSRWSPPLSNNTPGIPPSYSLPEASRPRWVFNYYELPPCWGFHVWLKRLLLLASPPQFSIEFFNFSVLLQIATWTYDKSSSTGAPCFCASRLCLFLFQRRGQEGLTG